MSSYSLRLIAGLRPLVLSATVLTAAFAVEAGGPAAALSDLREQLKLGQQPDPTTVMADIAGEHGKAAAKSIVASMARKISSGAYDFTVLDDRVIDDCGLVILRESKSDGSNRTLAYHYLKQDSWKALPLGVNDPRVTELSPEHRQRFTELSQWYAQRKREIEKTVSVPPTPTPIPTPTPPSNPTSLTLVSENSTLVTANAEEPDVEDPFLKGNIHVEPWTEIQRRSSFNGYLPSAMSIPAGHFHYHIVHVGKEAYYTDYGSNLLGLDDSVIIGIELGYGITKNLDVSLQRQNGHELSIQGSTKTVSFDYYDLLFRWHALDQLTGPLSGIADVGFIAGITRYQRNHGTSDYSLNFGAMVERNFLWDRLRLGTGIVHAGLSSFEAANDRGPENKPFPDENWSVAPEDIPEESTTSVPINIKIAIDARWQVYAEFIIPIAGYSTDIAPTATYGLRLNGNTHEYSFFVSNTPNASFTSSITGGASELTNLPFFGFNISAHL